eukprot:3646051-Pyramimonas_sp.AAC.1
MDIYFDTTPSRRELRKRVGTRACAGTRAMSRQATTMMVKSPLTGATGGEINRSIRVQGSIRVVRRA